MKNKSVAIIIVSLAILVPSLFFFLESLGIASAFSILFTVLTPLITSSCIAFVINIPMSMIEKLLLRLTHAKKPILCKLIRITSILISSAFVISIFSLFVALVIPEAKHAVEKLIQNIPTYMNSLTALFEKITVMFHLPVPDGDINWDSLRDEAMKLFDKYGAGILTATLDAAVKVVSAIASIIISVVMSFYILMSKEKIYSGLARICCALFSLETTEKLFSFLNLVNITFRKYISGQLTEAAILGALCFLGMKIFAFPYALMTASLMAITALVPMFGAFIGAAGGALMIFTVSPIKALWFLLFILILQQLENNIIYPRVVGKSVGLGAVWVFLAVMLGSSLFGIVGMLASVPIASVIYTILSKKTKPYAVKINPLAVCAASDGEAVASQDKKSE